MGEPVGNRLGEPVILLADEDLHILFLSFQFVYDADRPVG